MKNVLYSFLIAFALLLTGCANAGKDQQVNANTLVTLDGNASTPSVKGEITAYKWKQVKGHKVTLSSKKAVSPTFTAPNVTKKTRLVFRLSTKETGGLHSPFRTRDYVAITVLPAATTEVDTVKPVLTLKGDTNVTLTVGDTYIDEGATATDNKDGNITANISVDNPVDTATAGTYIITYTVSDEAGNEATETRTVTVELPEDTTAPVITLNGGDVTLAVGDTYIDEGATATDDRDGNVTVDINSTVDTTHAGIYTITYTATDSAGNSATATRTVTVNALQNISPIAVITVDKSEINVGDTVHFSSEESSDEDGQIVDYSWEDDVENVVSVDNNFTYTFTRTGTFGVKLIVIDNNGAHGTTIVHIHVTEDNNTTHNHSVSGKVTDSNGTAVSGARVAIAGHIVTTTADGSYTLSSVPAGERVLVNVTHPDYLANSRVTEVNTTDVTQNITLDTPKATLTFDAADGATISQRNGASVELPANGYIDANGTAYTGAVTVKMSYHAITTQSARATFPGTFEGIEGNTTFPIQSYGFMNVELTDENGNPVNLDGNSTATLTYPNDKSLHTPSTVPLWYYDKSQGYWIEEGEAVRTNNFYYVGTVTHFTSWNLDVKGKSATLTGCVKDENGNPVANANVQFKSANWNSKTVYTDENGSISVTSILAQENLAFTAYQTIGSSYYYGKYPSFINLNEGENKIINTCVVLKNTTISITIKGNLKYINTQYVDDYNAKLIVSAKNSTLVYYSKENVPEGDFNITIQILNNDTEFTVSSPGCDQGKTFLLKPNTNLYDVGTINFIPIC